MLISTLLHVASFSTVADFHTDSGSPDTVAIHDVPIVPAADISDVYDVPAVVALHTGCWCFVGGPVVAFILAVACVPAVAVLHCCHPCCCLLLESQHCLCH
jgi:hypothetical protein